MSEEKKIIVDEDWKEQVQAEKEAAKHETAADKGAAGKKTTPGDVTWPPASFEMLLTTLITEAMVALGHLPNPASGKMEVYPQQAKYFIDTIEVLRDKTKGNLNSGEEAAIDNALHQLRLAYVGLGQSAAADSAAVVDEEKPQS